MHQEKQFFTVESNFQGQELLGFAYADLRSLTVHIMRPFEGFSANLHLPSFAMGVHPQGFAGAYGRERALDLLTGLYNKHKDCTCTRKAALPYQKDSPDFAEFGRVRFIKTNPGHSDSEDVLDHDLNEDIFVRRERMEAKLLMRFFDRKTELPFLAEASPVERDGPSYVAGVQQDALFLERVTATRELLRDSMRRYRALLSSFGISLEQLHFLQEPDGVRPLPADSEALLSLGYVVKTSIRSASEKVPSLQKAERRLAEASRLEEKGAIEHAERIRKRAAGALRRIHATRLERTSTGYTVARSFPHTGTVWD